MDENLDHVIRQVLSGYRHLMTEAERRADRAFYFQEKIAAAREPTAGAEAQAALEQALGDPLTARLIQKGRVRFLHEMAQRIVAQHGADLPRCGTCGAVFKTPHPKTCFGCEAAPIPRPAVEERPPLRLYDLEGNGRQDDQGLAGGA